ncbi:MAG: T9SS type A sorting domain-containing protein [Saprospiraceae bacterium]|nr:T9SS type A sorting domain-containing protein [Saprospiraceae bacterium]MCF8251806.1 T9SS type A sorting domain-containing protein [Saprospiraceae bacterium]MCF8313520.1 T9SS type A sorting domain-containing protein [Saprospiraceae bacterium]
MKQPSYFWNFIFFIFCQFVPSFIQAQVTCTVSVNASQVINPASKKLLGTSFDGRSSMDFNAGPGVDPAGYFDPATGAILPAVEAAWNRLPVRGTRYPGNLEILNWNWSYTIGPFASRTAQPMGPNNFNPQALQFGFDEFMDTMTIGKGLPADEVQIMVNLYPSVGQPNPAILAADWVEYCNVENDGTNPRYGTDWAMLRDLYGHPDPYGIKIWNIGNEPWSPNELGNGVTGANDFIALAIPIIDSMLAADPTIHITVPAVGPSYSNWNSTLLGSSDLMSRVYGFSSHAFYDENPATGNPSISQVEVWLADLAMAANAIGKKVISGDHAHDAPNGDLDKAMRWEGALATANMLLMVSQVNNVELANFWIYGNVKAQWHPIRQNVGGTYTFMAVPQLYEQFASVFYDKSLSTTISNASGGGPVPNVRATAFKSNNGALASVVAVNIDLATDNEMIPPTMSGFDLQTVKLLTAPSINNDTFFTTTVLPLGNGNYLFPHTGVLIFDYQSSPLAVEYAEPMRAYPVEAGVRVEWATASESNSSHFEVERSAGGIDFEKIGKLDAQGFSDEMKRYHFIDRNPLAGLSYYRIKQMDTDGRFNFSKIMSVQTRVFELKMSPNPVLEELHLSVYPAPSDDAIFQLVNTAGQLVLEQKLSPSAEAWLNLSHLSDGIYGYRFWTGRYWLAGRLLKQ